MNIFIGCSSSEYISNKYLDDCKILLDKLFSSNYNLVFGVCNRGIMGLSHDIAKENNRLVTGICPLIYKKQLMDVSCDYEEVTTTVGERTRRAFEESDILLFLPGGIGTVYELFTAIESKRANEHNKPIIIYNVDGFYDELFLMLNKMSDEKFMMYNDFKNFYVFDNLDYVLEYIDKYSSKNKELVRKREC